MITLFTVCAVIGGTVLICQTLLTVLGLGSDADFPDIDDVQGMSGDTSASATTGESHEAPTDPGDGHASSALFKMLTLRALISASTFFGLAGLAADAAGLAPLQSMTIALIAGAIAIYAIHELMQFFGELHSDGTVRLQDAIDCEGQVYLRIPAARSGRGKIHVVLQGQTVELQAETGGDLIPGGTTVRVTDYLGTDVVSVMPVQIAPTKTEPPVVTSV